MRLRFLSPCLRPAARGAPRGPTAAGSSTRRATVLPAATVVEVEVVSCGSWRRAATGLPTALLVRDPPPVVTLALAHPNREPERVDRRFRLEARHDALC